MSSIDLVGTKYNHLQFVILGTHGVTPTTLSRADDGSSSQIYLYSSVRFGTRSFSSLYVSPVE